MNWSFGIFSTVPIFVTFISFKEDHLEHHRFNRSALDPDAFTMGGRKPLDFLLFYAYMLVGVPLTVLQFNFIYPFQSLRGYKLWIHVGEMALRVVVYTSLIMWTSRIGVLHQFLAVWLIPAGFFSVLNSIRFVAEHYGTPWEGGQLRGTRTIISNRVNSFFWNNINYHIGHHVYPAVPWYNLQKLHVAMLPAIEAEGALVEKSYLRIFFRACLEGPETIERNEAQLARRTGSQPTAPAVVPAREWRSGEAHAHPLPVAMSARGA
jgi:fatty acid desaturase